MESLFAIDFEHRLGQTAGAALVLFGDPDEARTTAFRLVIQSAAANRDWCLFQVDAAREAELLKGLGVRALPALWLYLEGDYHASVMAVAPAPAWQRPAALAAALARVRLGPPMPPPGA